MMNIIRIKTQKRNHVLVPLAIHKFREFLRFKVYLTLDGTDEILGNTTTIPKFSDGNND